MASRRSECIKQHPAEDLVVPSLLPQEAIPSDQPRSDSQLVRLRSTCDIPLAGTSRQASGPGPDHYPNGM